MRNLIAPMRAQKEVLMPRGMPNAEIGFIILNSISTIGQDSNHLSIIAFIYSLKEGIRFFLLVDIK